MLGNTNKIALYLILILVCFFMFVGTGLHGDDFTAIKFFKNKNFIDILFFNPNELGVWIYVLPAYLFFYIFYSIFETDYILGYDFLKVIIHISSTFFLYKFFSNFIDHARSLLASLFFVFFVSHDSTTFWYMASVYMLFFPSLVFYSFHLIYNDNLFRGSLFLTICSLCYSTPPVIFGLSLFFLLKKEFIKFFIFLSAGLIFILYYFSISHWFPITENRIDNNITSFKLLKNFIFQFLSSIDANIGLNSIYKLFYSLSYLDLLSIILSIFVSIILFLNLKNEQSNKINFNFVFFVSITMVYLLSLSMYALTGMYTQSAFNLGNRVTIYFCIVIGYILILIKNRHLLILLFSLLLVFPTLSMSQYWKQWNIKQNIIYENIKNNNELNNIANEILIVENNNYSKLGPFTHIELFAMNWHLETIFDNITYEENIISLSSYTNIEENKIIDTKSKKIINLSDPIYIYNSELNSVKKINKKNIIEKINEIEEIRHWSQLLENDNFIIRFALYLNPRLGYLF